MGIPKAWAAIDRNTTALNELIEDLLDVSRIATGKIRLGDVYMDLKEVVRDSVRAVEPKFLEKDVSLVVDLHPEPCGVRGDPARLRQVTSNLLSNAVKFTGAGGRVHVAVTCEDRAVLLVVTDTGIGIHPDFLPHVFEQFRQAEADATTGLGLGLAIVKNLVEQHGGSVAAVSDGIGRGARFTVRLPRAASAS
jgi:signal transduction histidine kinase